MIQPVNYKDQYNYSQQKSFCMIDNYIYLYHTDTLIAIPTYPDQIQDSMSAQFSQTSPLSRSAPIYSYVNSGPRTFQVTLNLHRDMMNSINVAASKLNVPDIESEDYVDIMLNQLSASVLPKYAASEKMVDPPIVAVRFGADFFCKGVISGAISKDYSGPILRNDKYALITVSFTLCEIDPYDAEFVMTAGGFRGLNQDLERRVYKNSTSRKTISIR